MDKPVVKHRKRLNPEQLEVLNLLYKFRYGSNELIAQYFGKKDRSFVYKRLSILLEQGLIGKRFDSSYRLAGKPAAYYLTPEGARRLQDAEGTAVNVKLLYKDRTASERFIKSSLELFLFYNRLKAQYGDSLKFFSKASLSYEDYDYFPQPLPDAYIRIEIDGHRSQFFVERYYRDQPPFKTKSRAKRYIDYDDSGEWDATGSEMPSVLVICDSIPIRHRVMKQIPKIYDTLDNPDLKFYLTDQVSFLSGGTGLWQLASEPGKYLKLDDIL